jgi:hypothetical protein
MPKKKKNESWIDAFMTEDAEFDRAANGLYQMYAAYIRAGFSEEQAFGLVGIMLNNALAHPMVKGVE